MLSGGEVFIKPRNKVKLLHWEYGGFVLYYKHVEKGTIEIPDSTSDDKRFSILWSELVMMIEGISLKSAQKQKLVFFEKTE